MHLDNHKEQQTCNMMTADSCQNIGAALNYVAEKYTSLSPKGVRHIQNYITEQVNQWVEQSNGKLTAQDIMYGLIRAHIIMQGSGDNARPVDVRYAIEHPMRISQMAYGIHSDDDKVARRMSFLIDMLFDDNKKPLYETQRLFLSALADNLIQSGQADTPAGQSVVKVLLDGMTRSAKEQDSWNAVSLGMTQEATCYLSGGQAMAPRSVATHRSNVQGHTIHLERQ